MSKPENFLERWSRLKRQARRADSFEQTGGTARQPPAQPKETSGTERQPLAQTEVPAADAKSSDTSLFDPATLPPIESIGPDSDIRPFLQPGVPEHLMGAALRSAWVVDPSIRDFVEMADNQWDFNDESAMPGFGPLGPSQYARELVNKALQSADNLTPSLDVNTGEVNMTTPPSAAMNGPDVIDNVWNVGAADVGSRDPCNIDSPPTPASNTPCQPAPRKSHGTALPK